MADPATRLMQAQQRSSNLGRVHADLVASRLGLGSSDLRAILLLLQGPASPSRLAGELGLTRGSVTALIDRLETAGFAVRDRPAGDRRRVQVSANHRRAQEAVALFAPLYEAMESIAASLSPAETAAVSRFLELVEQSLQARIAALSPAAARAD